MEIIAGFTQINQKQTERYTAAFKDFSHKVSDIEQLGFDITTLTIDPLSTDWHSPEKMNHFRSGCAPILALKHAQHLVQNGCDAVVISGEEPLKTGYSKAERHKLMSIYNDKTSIAQLYDELAHKFIDHHDSDKETFLYFADLIFQNHTKSHSLAINEQRAHFESPEPKWFNHVTSLFRGVDCANPLVDFTGKLLLCSEKLIDKLKIENKNRVSIKGVGLGILDIDEPKSLSQIVKYTHLTQAYNTACDQANLDFNQLVHDKKALMKVYTCYPVVPMAFLLNTGLVNSIDQIPDFLSEHLLTLSGGMNLARAPWNNPALYGLIEMYHQLCQTDINYGMVHGNGGIGYKQGVAILSSV
ncbi:hypothetical protein [Pseudoalteromonas denitrificans]|uniref:Acetyl-CoA acetyltransferase n=1 Tax=Pseudoalteromonas denitrificans DSM 6059 TaxID=1123010 RepID=A0A1I1P4G2_9GAMM|nr:hypothetical protein [Pseudoalteromonas denitrificans]SFD04844.1 hypothetical protein SAMN02745724_03310 [Pseudoalteromonas denitrificans DSM 6059]